MTLWARGIELHKQTQTILRQYARLLPGSGLLQGACTSDGTILFIQCPEGVASNLRVFLDLEKNLAAWFPDVPSLLDGIQNCSVRCRSRCHPEIGRSISEMPGSGILRVEVSMQPVFVSCPGSDIIHFSVPAKDEAVVQSGDNTEDGPLPPSLLVEPHSGVILECDPMIAGMVGMESHGSSGLRIQELGMREFILQSMLQVDRPVVFPVSIHPSQHQRHWILSRSETIDERTLLRIWVVGSVEGWESRASPSDTMSEAYRSQWMLRPDRVLICDDNELLTGTVQTMLDWAGISHHTALNGKDALQLLEHFAFDVLLLDLNMPRLNGFDTARIIRQCRRRYAGLPIVAMTATPFEGFELRGQLQHFDAILQKPFDVEDLRIAIERGQSRARGRMVAGEQMSTENSVTPPEAQFLPTSFMMKMVHQPEKMEPIQRCILETLKRAQLRAEESELHENQPELRTFLQQTGSMATTLGAQRLACVCHDLMEEAEECTVVQGGVSLAGVKALIDDAITHFESDPKSWIYSNCDSGHEPIAAA
jgi:CheY-like chemotaxis protein